MKNPFRAPEKNSEANRIDCETWLTPHPSFRLKKILVPLDFSGRSLKAALYAAAMAKEFGAEILFLHVVNPYPVTPDDPGLMGSFQEQLIDDGRAQLEKVVARIPDAKCHALLRVGVPAAEIVAAGKQEAVDLIIIGTHGRGGIAHAFLGSVAERVARQADCPVLVVRAREHDFVVPAADDPELNRIVEPCAGA